MRRPQILDTLATLFLAVVFCACGKDDGPAYPAVVTDLVTLTTQGADTIAAVRLDNGEEYGDLGQRHTGGFPADTTLRCLASYTLTDGRLRLRGAVPVFCQYPQPDSLDVAAQDPVKLISAWKSGGYINLHLGVMAMDASLHEYAFHQQGDGRYALSHRRPEDDPEAYTEHVYLSMHIPEGVEHPSVTILTYEGECVKTF